MAIVSSVTIPRRPMFTRTHRVGVRPMTTYTTRVNPITADIIRNFQFEGIVTSSILVVMNIAMTTIRYAEESIREEKERRERKGIKQESYSEEEDE